MIQIHTIPGRLYTRDGIYFLTVVVSLLLGCSIKYTNPYFVM